MKFDRECRKNVNGCCFDGSQVLCTYLRWISFITIEEIHRALNDCGNACEIMEAGVTIFQQLGDAPMECFFRLSNAMVCCFCCCLIRTVQQWIFSALTRRLSRSKCLVSTLPGSKKKPQFFSDLKEIDFLSVCFPNKLKSRAIPMVAALIVRMRSSKMNLKRWRNVTAYMADLALLIRSEGRLRLFGASKFVYFRLFEN